MSFGGGASGLVLSSDTAPVGTTGDLADARGSFYATLEGWECDDYDGPDTSIVLTVNEAEHVAGTVEGTWACASPDPAVVEVVGRFDHRGPID